MCTRFYIEPETEELLDLLEEAKQSRLGLQFMRAGSKVLTSGEIRPTDVVPVIASNKTRKQSIFPMKWGFQIPGRSLLVNARSETAAEKPAFKEAWKNHRCIIPASWYYEWEHLLGSSGQKKTGDKYMIQPRGSSMTWLAGIYRMENGFPFFTVLTREPTDELRHIHDRMPLIMPRRLIEAWISPDINPQSLVQYAVTDVVAEKA